MTDYLGSAYPKVASSIGRFEIAALPTPVSQHKIGFPSGARCIYVKHDDLTSNVYGGNKVRKLEYILCRAAERGAKRIATFGAAGSNHALATAIHARRFDFDCTCFLAHQKPTPNISTALAKHVELGTEVIRFGGTTDKLALFRAYLQHRNAWVVPLGGSCWYGALGFVNAGLELAVQIESGELEQPSRIYIANGTMGSSAGLALGLALAGVAIDLHAVRVAANAFAKPMVLQRLIEKTASLMHRCDPSVPADLASRTRVTWRDGFFAGGYAAVDDATRDAVTLAEDQLGIALDTTYTGKAMAALVQDAANSDEPVLFWNTYSSAPLQVARTAWSDALPADFRRYFQ